MQMVEICHQVVLREAEAVQLVARVEGQRERRTRRNKKRWEYMLMAN
jgi:hypothetical protein